MAIKARAQKTLTKIFDGSGVFSIIITNENTSIPISNQGLPLNYSSTPTDAYVYSGTSLLTPVTSNPEAGQYTLTASGENISAGLITINGNHASVANASNMSVGKDTYSITLTASGKDFLGNPFSAQKKQVITPLKRGDDATSYWENVTSSVITKDVKGNMTPDSTTVSAVYQSGMADPDSYSAIFKVYLKNGINFSTTPDYTSSSPEQSYKIVPNSDTNDIKVEMYDATGTSLLDIQTIPIISQANGVISTKIVYTVTSSQSQPDDSANWSDTVPTVGKGQYLWTKTTFYYTDGSNVVAYSMGSNGKDGASASLLTLTSDSQAFTFDSDGKTPLPTTQTITLTANLQNVTGTATFVATPYSGTAAGTPIILGGTGNVRTITVSQFGSTYDSVVIKATLGSLIDTETIHKLSNGGTGKDAISGWLTNEAITLQADSNGNVPSFTSATGSFVVYNGTSQVTGLTVTQSGATGITLSISGMNYSVTGMSQDNGYVDLSVTNAGVTITKRLTVSKSKAGATGANGTSVVNSTTPPSNPTEGQWWNDLSVTPNILKVYQKGSWIPYRIDAINLVAGSVKTDNLAADVLLASNVKYTNSNGTTTNLQTFDFDGIKTLLSDSNGNTYSSMDTAVSSTQSWTSLSKQVNSLGQINQLFNTEFSPDFAGWNVGVPNTSGKFTATTPLSSDTSWSLSSEKFDGSNVLLNTYGSGYSSINSGLIPIGGNVLSILAMEAYSSSSYNGTVTASLRFYYYDSNQNYISSTLKDSSKISSWTRLTASATSPSNAAYVVVAFVTNGSVGTSSYSQPIMVFSGSIGDYVQGNYNNNARVLAIETSASQFQVKISGDVTKAQSTADTANNTINNLSVGGRNLLLGTSVSITGVGNNSTNGNFNAQGAIWNLAGGKKVSDLYNQYGSSGYLTISFDWVASGSTISGTFNPQWNNTPWGGLSISGGVKTSSTNTSGHYENSVTLSTGGYSTGTATGVMFRQDNLQGNITISNLKLESGNQATDWTPAPEDVQSGISSAQTSADTANTNLSNASQSGIRYLRFRGEGNTDNQASHFGNISVFNTVGTDILSGKTATTVGNPTISGNGLGAATDGKYNTTYTGIEYNATNHEQYIMFDLGSLRYDVNKIEIGMWTTTRTYYGVKAQSSTDGNTWQTIYVGNITPNQLVGNSTTGQVVGTTISFGMDTSTVLKVAADNYTLGIDANGNLISGITGNTQSITIKGAMIHLDGNTVVDQGFFSLWNGQYGSTTIDSTGMEVVTGKAKTKFGDGAMSLISAAGENIGWIGRQVDSVYSNLDFLTIGLNGWQTTAPGDEHYDKDPNNPDAFYGGDGIIFGISTVGGGYLPLLMYNTPLAASYRSGIAGWMFTQPIVGGIDIYGDNMKADNTVSWRFKNLNTRGFTYPFLTSQQADNANANTGIILGSGTMYFYGGNNAVMSIRQNGFGYYDAQKFGSGGSALYMAGDGALIAHSSATKYKTNIVRSSTTELGDKLLTLDLASWNDKDEDRQLKEYNETGKRTDYAIDMDGARYYGLIAEDLVKADLEEFVVRNPITGSVETIQYDKIGVAWIPLVRQQRDMINQLKFEIEKIKEKINE